MFPPFPSFRYRESCTVDKKIAIQAALFRQLLAASNASIASGTLLALVLAYMQYGIIASAPLLGWMAFVLLVALARFAMAWFFRRTPPAITAAGAQRLRGFRLGVLASGAAWGAAGILLFPPNDPHHQMFLIFMLAGLTAGATVSYAADPFSSAGFSVLALAPLLLRLLLAGDSISLAMGIAAALYLLFLLVTSRHLGRGIRENIVLRLEASEREMAMKVGEERYRLLLNHSPAGIFHFDTALVITYCNNRLAEIMNSSAERLVGLDLKSLKDQAALPVLRKTLAGESGTWEGYYAATFSDAKRWLALSCAPSRDGAGNIAGGIAIIQDVTALHESHQQILALLNSMAEGAYCVDTGGNCLFVNRAFLRILGFERAEEIIGRHIHELIHHSHRDGSPYPAAECKMYNAYRHNQEIHQSDEVFWKKDGTAIPVEYWSQPILEDGVMQGAIATFIDISERQQMLSDLRESEERFRQMFERHSAAMLLIDPQSGEIVDANPAAANFYGYSLDVLPGMNIGQINTLTPAEVTHERQTALNEERNHFVFEHRLANGAIRTVEVHSSPLRFKNKSLLYSIIHDITGRKLAEAQIRKLAFYDTLTQLPNRRLLDERLERAIAASRRSGRCIGVMFIDLDNFKPLNDLHGHAAGDLLLIEVAARLKNSVRQIDTVARFGGDEFVVVLCELSADKAESLAQAASIADKIRRILSEPYVLETGEVSGEKRKIAHRCTTSIGVTVCCEQEISPDNLIDSADAAMYRAKISGRDAVQFYTAQD